MQVRSIEFQENFGRVTVEGARQQNLLQREPEVGQHQAARMAADEQVLNLNRPTPATPTEGNVIDPNSRRFPERRAGGPPPDRASGEVQPEGTEGGRRPRAGGVSGARIDVVA